MDCKKVRTFLCVQYPGSLFQIEEKWTPLNGCRRKRRPGGRSGQEPMTHKPHHPPRTLALQGSANLGLPLKGSLPFLNSGPFSMSNVFWALDMAH